MQLVWTIALAVFLTPTRDASLIQLHDYQPGYDCSGSGQVNMWLFWSAPGYYHITVKKNGNSVYRGGTQEDINLGNQGVTVRNGDVFSIWYESYGNPVQKLNETTAVVLPGDPDHCN